MKNSEVAKRAVRNHASRTGSNFYSDWRQRFFAIYSYGPHHPLAYFDRIRSGWVVNRDTLTSSTDRHKQLVLSAISNASSHIVGYLGTAEMKEALSYRFSSTPDLTDEKGEYLETDPQGTFVRPLTPVASKQRELFDVST